MKILIRHIKAKVVAMHHIIQIQGVILVGRTGERLGGLLLDAIVQILVLL